MSKVEWKTIGEICDVITGGEVPRDTVKGQSEATQKYPYAVYTNGKEVYGFSKTYQIDSDAVCISSIGANTGTVFYKKGRFTPAIRLKVLIPQKDVITRFLYYATCLIDFRKKNSGSVPNINADYVKNQIVPIPSRSEQNRIVGILDTFTSSIENLKQQISERRKQYEYYRDQLLDLEGKEEKDIRCWGEFCEMIKGNGVQKTDFVDEGVGCIHYGQIYTHYRSFTYTTNKFVTKETFDKSRKASKSDIIMTDTSENVEDICKSVAYLGEEDIAVSNHALIIKHKQNPKFLSYSTQTNSFFLQKRKVVVGVKVSGIKPDHLAQIKIYLPNLVEQQRIVSILDTFEASISNLEAQLKEREKQYDYYRNKLLTFE